MTSLKCLSKLRELSPEIIPYSKLHPMKVLVLKSLGKVIDDKKRVVRKFAAKVRNEWML